ncbi:protealysin inhibitor emfourin [Streptomyces sp. NRRL S-15]|uniref:protealysin inhibitor emfourin n=1 Tax=Streptomyces sp. NRRL S-15 TaxID=1463886 RepID=UPI000A65F7BD
MRIQVSRTPPAGVPDGFRYRITVGDLAVDCADPRLTEAQRTLISRVLKEGA